MRTTLLIATCMACIAISAKGHEFWIDSEDYRIAPGDNVVARLRVGTEFEGSEQAYIPRNFRRFDYVQGAVVNEVPGVVGDRPAANFAVGDEGLLVLVHQTRDLSLTWDSWDKFEGFVRHKDAGWVVDEHLAAGDSKDSVREVYSRYAKSLVAVGAGSGDDVVTGMLTEIVALENPYTGDMTDGIDVRVLYDGVPRETTQVEVFERAPGGEVRIFTVRTDGEGVATVPVAPGHTYMLDSVVLRRPVSPPENGNEPMPGKAFGPI